MPNSISNAVKGCENGEGGIIIYPQTIKWLKRKIMRKINRLINKIYCNFFLDLIKFRFSLTIIITSLL